MDFIFNLMTGHDDDMIIGHGTKLPGWQNTDDFKENLVKKTMGHAIMFGSSTAIEMKPLKGRFNIAVTQDAGRSQKLFGMGYNVVSNVYQGIDLALKEGHRTIWNLGGAKMYEYCLRHFLFNELHISHIHGSFPAANKETEIRFCGIPYDIYKVDPSLYMHFPCREPNPAINDKGNKHACTVEVWRR